MFLSGGMLQIKVVLLYMCSSHTSLKEIFFAVLEKIAEKIEKYFSVKTHFRLSDFLQTWNLDNIFNSY
uniref:Putative secreted protein n=1 Tax=Panstrongylus lignarius TaxID=156445 RepID=A0A224Y1K0_9HEMI